MKFQERINLAAERLGAATLSCSDDFFAPMANLVKPGRGIFIEDKYTERGKWMDGWESRRKRVEGHDWCVLKLGLSGIVRGVDIDTNHFLGNHPPMASLDGACVDGTPTDKDWRPILSKVNLEPGSQNLFEIDDNQRLTHLRLNIFPDGGVARLKVYGDVVPDWEKVGPEDQIDLASVEYGGVVLGCNDMFFSSKDNLIMPGRGLNMGDGWETKRRRTPGYDWVVLQLGAAGLLSKIEVDTHYFKGNYPDRVSIEGIMAIGKNFDDLCSPEANWELVLPESKLEADTQHYFTKELSGPGPYSHIRMNIFPDGGISRLRVVGTVTERIAGK
jgi:allantoicase